MSGRVAKALRKVVWGESGSPRLREHYLCHESMGRNKNLLKGRCCVADENRTRYQRLKRAFKGNRPAKLRHIRALA